MENNEDFKKEDLLRAFDFTDIYFVKDHFPSSYMYKKDCLDTKKITKNNALILKGLFDRVVQEIETYSSRKDHLIIYQGFYFRCYQINSINGSIIACRQMPQKYQSLEDCRIDERIRKELLHPRLNKGGLIFICGSPGQGKTTTVSALIRDRLKLFGGLCITVEDPPEMPLDGTHNLGRCIQTQVDSQFGFADAIRASMRAYPTNQNTLMFIGEIRDKETASEALKAAIDGRLIVATLHSDSVFTGLQRIASLAEGILGSEEAYLLLAESFRLAIHQKLISSKISKGKEPKVGINFLSDSNAVYGKLQTKQISMLKNEFETQSRILRDKKSLEYRNT